jgi:DNA modification methylase
MPHPTPDAPGLAIRRVPVASLHLDPSNAREHGTENMEAIVGSLKRFQQVEPLVVQKSTGRVIGGNGRLVAMRKLGWTECDVVEVEVDDLTATALGIALNRTSELATWDEATLAKLLQELKVNEALDGVGYTPEDLDRLIAGLDIDLGADHSDEDEIPEPPEEPVTRRGDLWVLGRHRLFCGDSSSADDADRLLAGARVQLVNTDPPYNVRVEPRSNNAIAAGLSSFPATRHHQALDLARHPAKSKPTHKKLRAKDRPLENDFVSDEEFVRLLDAWFGNIARVLEPGGGFYIWGGYANCANYPPALRRAGLYFSQSLIWVKEHPVLTRKDFMGNHEWCFYGWREGAAHRFFGPANVPDVWSVKKVNPQSMVHLCLHPEAAVLTEKGYRPISSLKVGDRVLSGDGRFHNVVNVSSHPYTSEHLYRITAKGGNATIDASDNHPFLIWRPSRRGAAIVGGEVGWVRADELKVGDYTMTPVPIDSDTDPFPDSDDEYWFLFGLYLAQGHLQCAGHGDRRYPAFSIHKKRQDLAERIWRKWPNAREYDPNDYSPVPTSGLTVMAFDGDAGERFEALGGRLAHGKHLAPEVFALPRSKRLAVLQGWLNGDGCMVHDRTYWQGSTVSPDLAAQLNLLAESVGYRTTVYSYDPPDDLGGIGGRRFKSQRRVYHLYFYERGQLAKRGRPTYMEHEGREYSLRYVKKIEQVRYEGNVWNLSVESHPSFQTAIGLSHNTEKPVELARRAILYSSRTGENVLDLFGGSGSTLIAAEETSRKAYLMEIDPLYSDVILRRFEKFTSKEATLDRSGKTFREVAAERGVTVEEKGP